MTFSNSLMVWSMLVCLMTLISFTMKTKNKQREKLTPFECGFDPDHKTRNSFSLRFFIITIIFLIFDVEICIIFPLPLNKMKHFLNFFLYNIFFFFLLFLGLLFEWWQGALKWQ